MTNPAILEALARAIHCHDGRLPTPWDADMITRWPDDCEYERKVAMSQAAAVLALVGPKPLVWLVLGDGNPRDIYSSLSIAASPYGPYFIGHSPKSGDQYCWSGPCNSGGRWFPTLAAAQAAAQAHADAAHWANTKLGDLIGKEPKT